MSTFHAVGLNSWHFLTTAPGTVGERAFNDDMPLSLNSAPPLCSGVPASDWRPTQMFDARLNMMFLVILCISIAFTFLKWRSFSVIHWAKCPQYSWPILAQDSLSSLCPSFHFQPVQINLPPGPEFLHAIFRRKSPYKLSAGQVRQGDHPCPACTGQFGKCSHWVRYIAHSGAGLRWDQAGVDDEHVEELCKYEWLQRVNLNVQITPPPHTHTPPMTMKMMMRRTTIMMVSHSKDRLTLQCLWS